MSFFSCKPGKKHSSASGASNSSISEQGPLTQGSGNGTEKEDYTQLVMKQPPPSGPRPEDRRFLRVVERGFRFALGAILPMLIGLHGAPAFWPAKHELKEEIWISLNFTYVIPMIYCVLAALAPPYWAGVPVAVGAGVMGLLMAFAAASLGLYAASSSLWMGWFAFVCCIMMIAPVKIGFIRPGLRDTGPSLLTSLAGLYVGTLFFIMAINVVNPGFHITAHETPGVHGMPPVCKQLAFSGNAQMQGICLAMGVTEAVDATGNPQLMYLMDNLCLPKDNLTFPTCKQLREAEDQAVMQSEVRNPILDMEHATKDPAWALKKIAEAMMNPAKTMKDLVRGAKVTLNAAHHLAGALPDAIHHVADPEGTSQPASKLPLASTVQHKIQKAMKKLPLSAPLKQAGSKALQKGSSVKAAIVKKAQQGQKAALHKASKVSKQAKKVAAQAVGVTKQAHEWLQKEEKTVHDSAQKAILGAEKVVEPMEDQAKQFVTTTGTILKNANSKIKAVVKPMQARASAFEKKANTELESAKADIAKKAAQATKQAETLAAPMASDIAAVARASGKKATVAAGKVKQMVSKAEAQVGKAAKAMNAKASKTVAAITKLSDPIATEAKNLMTVVPKLEGGQSSSSSGRRLLLAPEDDVVGFVNGLWDKADGVAKPDEVVPELQEEQELTDPMQDAQNDLHQALHLTPVTAGLPDAAATQPVKAAKVMKAAKAALKSAVTAPVEASVKAPKESTKEEKAPKESTKGEKAMSGTVDGYEVHVPCTKRLEGLSMTAELCDRKMTLQMQGGAWVLDILWNESWDGPFGGIQTFFVVFLLAVGLYAASVMVGMRTSYSVLIEHWSDALWHEVIPELEQCAAPPNKGATVAMSGKEWAAVARQGQSEEHPCSRAQKKLEGIEWATKAPAFEPGVSSHGVLMIKVFPPIYEGLHALTKKIPLVQQRLWAQAPRHGQAEQVFHQASVVCVRVATQEFQRSNAWCSRPDPQRVAQVLQQLNATWEQLSGLPDHDPVRLHILEDGLYGPIKGFTEAVLAFTEPPSVAKRGALSFGALIGPGLLPFAVFLVNLAKMLAFPRWGRFWTNREFQLGVQIVLGIAGLVLLPIMVEGVREWGLPKETKVSGSSAEGSGLNGKAMFGIITSMAGNGPGWMVLGFLVCHCRTVEGTAHKVVLRSFGTLIGAFLAWIALAVVDYREEGGERASWKVGFLTFWVCFWCFMATVLGAAKEPLLGFDRSFGYGFQVITYTMAIIIMDSWASGASGDVMVATRLGGQVVGIGMCFLMSITVFPSWAGSDVGLLCTKVLKECKACLILTDGVLIRQPGLGDNLPERAAEALEAADTEQIFVKEMLDDSLLFHELDAVKLRTMAIFRVDHRLPIIVEATAQVIECTKELVKVLESPDAQISDAQRGQVHAHTERVARMIEVTMLKLQSGGRGVGGSRVLEEASINAVVHRFAKELEDQTEIANLPASWALYDHALHNIEGKLTQILGGQMSK